MKRALGPTLCLCGLLAGGCASLPARAPAGVPAPRPRPVSFGEALAAYDAYARSLQSVNASGDLTVGDLKTGKSRRIGVKLVAEREDRLYLKGSVAVISALEVVSNGEQFWFVLPTKKKAWTGPARSTRAPDESADAEAPYRALRPHDVNQALLPAPLAPEPGESLVFETDLRTVALTLVRSAEGRGLVRRRVCLTRDGLQLARLTRFNEDGEVESDVQLAAWQEGWPRRITLLRPLEGYQATFAFDKVQTNVPVPERAFLARLPEGYTVVPVED